MNEGTVSLRSRDDGDLGAISLEELLQKLEKEAEPRL